MIIRLLQEAWKELEKAVKEGISQLSTLCSMEVKIKNQGSYLENPKEQSQELLKAVDIRLPFILPHREVHVVTRKKLTKQRKTP
ncbi:MAG: hypothetical protein QME07_05935 [bacterium]|nr:hypothetical protein [bacterium]